MGRFFVRLSGGLARAGRRPAAGAREARAQAEQRYVHAAATVKRDSESIRPNETGAHALHVYVPAHAGYKRFCGSRISPRSACAWSASQRFYS